MKNNIWLNGIMGVVVGDALGRPVEYMSAEAIASRPNGPVTGMEAKGTYNKPIGTWTDDSSMTLATLASLVETGSIVDSDIMQRFADWGFHGEYTTDGDVFDIGGTCAYAIRKFRYGASPEHCGKTGEHANGNGSLMRIMPIIVYAYLQQKCGGISDSAAIDMISRVSALTHNHVRTSMACGIYYFVARALCEGGSNLTECLQKGMNDAKAFYNDDPEWVNFSSMENISVFALTPALQIEGNGYVVNSLKASVWCLANSSTYAEATLKAVNLGKDTDTTAAICGGLAGLYYGYNNIPASWVDVIIRRDYIEDLCEKANAMLLTR